MQLRNEKQNGNRYPVPALDKGLDLVEVLADKPSGLALVELAAASNKKVSEIFRMVDCLKRRGYIVVDPQTDRLTLSMKLYELAHRFPPTARLLTVAIPAMQILAHNTGQSCHLAVHSNGEMLVIAQVDNARSMGFAVRVGGKVGLTNSASGRAYLAFQENGEQRRLLALAQLQFKLRKLRRNSQLDEKFEPEDNFVMSVEKARRKGYVSMPSDLIRGITNMSYPILGFTGTAVAALTIPHLQWEGDDEYPNLAGTRIMLGDTAACISGSIGSIPTSTP